MAWPFDNMPNQKPDDWPWHVSPRLLMESAMNFYKSLPPDEQMEIHDTEVEICFIETADIPPLSVSGKRFGKSEPDTPL
jgi:hypothetical protein